VPGSIAGSVAFKVEDLQRGEQMRCAGTGPRNGGREEARRVSRAADERREVEATRGEPNHSTGCRPGPATRGQAGEDGRRPPAEGASPTSLRHRLGRECVGLETEAPTSSPISLWARNLFSYRIMPFNSSPRVRVLKKSVRVV
jgi:hypothetical protein